ncbi:hypothetical protein LIER_38748 [Lithospermum erythrorhizon]|uniref:Protein COFACTOR ASSEMBLY OF COMPLEX C SUBUNIT B CCB4, chloroplastic n=1 Tax=Lithospermum erythrorhizon TaxID=34254 RepID=A0AAV3Q580_LITER
MEAGSLLPLLPLKPPLQLSPNSSRRRISSFRRHIKISASLNSKGDYIVPKPKREWVADWVQRNDDVVRSLPIYVGGVSLLVVLINRAFSGIAPVADASSSQSRADLLTLGLAVTNILTGLVWLSIRPKSISVVTPEGVDCQWISPRLPQSVTSELLWAWDSLSTVTCCRSLVVVYDGRCVFQIGVAALSSSNKADAMSVDTTKLVQGSLYQGVITSSSQSYLANLSLYPGKSELPFMPPNTQAVILQPLGDKGIAILGGDTIRGFTTLDQAWITLLGEKLDATLSKVQREFAVEVQQ